MMSCNARGFLCVSHADRTVVKNIKEKIFLKKDNGYAFYFSIKFDAFQNGIIAANKPNAYPVYLCNDIKEEKICLGNTLYTIFPNTAEPLSYPFYHKHQMGSYLFIECQEEVDFSIDYEGVLLKFFKPLQGSYPYYSSINAKQEELITFKKTANISPISLTINYTTTPT